MSEEENLLREMAADENVPAHIRLGALKELSRRGESSEATAPEGSPGAALEAMKDLVEEHCPGAIATWDTPADVSRVRR
jgi:hypothetical protein